jgi:hypothetical protein
MHDINARTLMNHTLHLGQLSQISCDVAQMGNKTKAGASSIHLTIHPSIQWIYSPNRVLDSSFEVSSHTELDTR